jgi:hypothetical protein
VARLGEPRLATTFVLVIEIIIFTDEGLTPSTLAQDQTDLASLQKLLSAL